MSPQNLPDVPEAQTLSGLTTQNHPAWILWKRYPVYD